MKLAREHWTRKDWADFGGELAGMAEDGYREFVLRGTPMERPFIGVRVPKTRAMAKEILRGNWREFLMFEPVSFEELNIRGFVIAGLAYEEMMEYVEGQVGMIENWGNCDSFCCALKVVRGRREDFLPVVEKFLGGGEFAGRAGLVILLAQYMDFEYLQVIFECVDRMAGREEYYVRMAVAWLLAECFVHFPEVTEGYLRTAKLPKWTYNRTISKICDSYRVEAETKARLRKTRR